MPRRPETPGQPLTEILKVRITKEEAQALDAKRGDQSRSEFVRAAIRARTPADVQFPHDAAGVDGHRHRPGDWVAERTLMGETVNTYRCATEGCGELLERKKR